ncbi:type III secretion system export apparatus subunit SctS [Bordetella bronchialis]|uniref:EscS/YscS/HrcS family type III secretion system export apparatus protein n=1 Tax=Bordetella bronchialis TaxID=463025 RepID=A0A193FMF8_9BORD|nr:type III secretion system export apparatus subunit SctS [Bordetella bronchialis]ANN68289.1 EscS/YscS/HrcS family type III secretion system export apparatus protein [Bordetella bronchialis]ANN73429.1 EscS/YscS/HrcS family type III secretion system export apparatus protein [Bordetella bronchialis]
MNVADLVFYLKEALYLVFWLSLPPLAVASIVGTLFSLFQALTQIQEQTLSFAIKLLAVFVTLLLTAGWIGAEIFHYSLAIFESFRAVR